MVLRYACRNKKEESTYERKVLSEKTWSCRNENSQNSSYCSPACICILSDRNPAFACIGVIFGMGVDMKDSIQNGGNRLFGTLIGGVLAVILFRVYLFAFPEGGHSMYLAVLLFIGIIVLIQLCRTF